MFELPAAVELYILADLSVCVLLASSSKSSLKEPTWSLSELDLLACDALASGTSWY